MSSVLLVVVLSILLISLLSIWFYPSVQDFMASNIMWNGIKSFSGEIGAETVNSLADLPSSTEEPVLVTVPYLEYSEEELAKLQRFVNDGGTILLMDDYGYGNSLLAYLGVGVRFSNKPLLDPLFSYKNQSMPRITDFTPNVRASGIGAIVLNHASALTDVPEPAIIAWSSSTSFLDLDESGSWEEGEPRGHLAVAAEMQLGKGRLALVADPSVMINSMAGRDDNQAFLNYLTRQQSEEKKVLVDTSHLSRAPLDVSKTRLLSTREMLASPYALLAVTAMVFVVVSGYTLRKGGPIG